MTLRPERALPTLLRHDTGEFYDGHGYQGALRPGLQGAQQ